MSLSIVECRVLEAIGQWLGRSNQGLAQDDATVIGWRFCMGELPVALGLQARLHLIEQKGVLE